MDDIIAYANSEEEVFQLLDLEWVDPQLRNADAWSTLYEEHLL